jgi:glycerol uptake facilitator protein
VGRLPPRRAPGYILMQFLGAFSASAALYALFAGPLRAFESAHRIIRGAPGSESSAMIFGEYFPNPSWHPALIGGAGVVSPGAAFLAEAAGTLILVLVILCVTDGRNRSHPGPLAPAMIGLTITMLISLFGPLTMAGFNPARDLAPRLFSALAGWGSVAFTANGSGWLVVYVVAPVAGGLAGALAYRLFFRPHYAAGAD